MKMYLMLEGLFGYVDGSVDVLSQLDIERDAKALVKICLSVKTCCYIHISKAKTAKEVCDNLKNAFEGHSMSTAFELTRKLLNLKQRDLGSMEKYINEILVTVQKLADMGEPLDDKRVAFIMMNGVMEEYEALISSLKQSDEKLTAEKVKITLLNESERRRVKSNQVPLSNSTSALLVNEAHRQKKFKKKTFKCYNCGDPNHKKPDCPKLRVSSQASKRPDTQGKPRIFLT
nr:unnamed protein product [Callosobruchus analis]